MIIFKTPVLSSSATMIRLKRYRFHCARKKQFLKAPIYVHEHTCTNGWLTSIYWRARRSRSGVDWTVLPNMLSDASPKLKQTNQHFRWFLITFSHRKYRTFILVTLCILSFAASEFLVVQEALSPMVMGELDRMTSTPMHVLLLLLRPWASWSWHAFSMNHSKSKGSMLSSVGHISNDLIHLELKVRLAK